MTDQYSEGGKAARPWWKKKRFIIPIVVVVLLVIAGLVSPDKDDESTSAGGSTSTAQTSAANTEEPSSEESVVPEEPTSEAPEPAPAPEGPPADQGPDIDKKQAPQDWFNDMYRDQNCGAKSIEYGGPIMCDAKGVDVQNDGKTLEIYMPNTDPVKKHFEQDSRKDAFAVSMASMVGQARKSGEDRVYYVEEVRIVADGGWLGSWDRTQNINELGFSTDPE